MQYDYLIVGSGLYGAVFAYRTTQQGKRWCGNPYDTSSLCVETLRYNKSPIWVIKIHMIIKPLE